ncbi:hypothetical protein DV737_g1820, partial [Chaetothyriales sp. CBS 132003]
MADALCGPSNPLQSLRKHTQLDRTLQQDRIVQSHQPVAEQFRSHDPRTAFRDAVVSEAQAVEQTLDDVERTLDNAEQSMHELCDAIAYTEVKDRTADQDMRDADELARTAGQLVEMMKDESETNRKFRESEFLGLMRRLRDREVEQVQTREEENDVATTATTEQYDWAFPDINDIYAPTNNDLDTASRSYSPFWEPSSTTVAPASATSQQPQTQAGLLGPYLSRDELYHSGSDEFPDHQQLQEQALHPVVMSGAVTPDATATNGGDDSAIKVSRFDNGDTEESGSLARPFSASRPRSSSLSAAFRRLA